ncbi:MAG: recombination protein RecR [Bacteroidetes bacterium]|nr:MAG: recombination protein RecR [Bacteroidota bacterium]REJ99909.1 MAG: recombination protein RecR [Bacteroidota bacterium]REK35911.1 MAG: recombination protein RecR [Bacteroidota bacterium]REK50612.1 MAG: recombination protein RecR [Bacteroidota bacterium]
MSTFSSRILEETVNAFSRLPGIGKRSALRLVLHLLKSNPEEAGRLGSLLARLRSEIRYCKVCNNICEAEVCQICSGTGRDHSVLCIVEDIRDVIAIENTEQYKGLYHVLGGLISPMDGIGPEELNISGLIERVRASSFTEIILALSTTMEGDTTSFYLVKKLKLASDTEFNISTIARGISVGDELEYADEVTLGRSILHRVPYEGSSVQGKNKPMP